MGLQTQMGYNMGQTGVEQSAKLRQHLGSTVNTKGLQDWATGPKPGDVQTTFDTGGPIRQDQGPTDRAAIEQAMMGRYNQDSQRTNAAQDAQLAARGMSPGSSQWGAVSDQQQRGRNDAVQQAYLASGQESRAAQEAFNQAQNQRYGQNQGAAQFFNAAGLQKYQMGQDYASSLNNLRQAQFGERLQLRNQPINEITALMGGSQVTNPQYQAFSRQGINAAPIGSYIQQNYGQQAQQAAAMNQGFFNLAGAGLYGGLTGGFKPWG
jgi:hypothetical protein